MEGGGRPTGKMSSNTHVADMHNEGGRWSASDGCRDTRKCCAHALATSWTACRNSTQSHDAIKVGKDCMSEAKFRSSIIRSSLSIGLSHRQPAKSQQPAVLER